MSKKPEIILTYQYRIKDSNKALKKNLFRLSGYVNFIWNYCNNTQKEAVKRQRKWLSGFDLNNLTAGTNKAFKFPIPAQTVQSVCEEYAKKRKQFKKPFLNNRTNRKNRNLPWIPLKKTDLKYDNKDSFTFNKLKIKTWFSRDFLELQHQIENY